MRCSSALKVMFFAETVYTILVHTKAGDLPSPTLHYSMRNAAVGSICIARRAGPKVARIATSSMAASTIG